MKFKPDFESDLRTSESNILSEKELITSQKLFSDIFSAISGVSAIINNNRQIVYANNDFLDLLGLKSLEPILGKRLGETVSCIHSEEQPSGCGTSKSCEYCGAVNAIMESQRTNNKSVSEAFISSYINGKQISWDLKISSSPIILADQVFYVLSLKDISSEKRLRALERTFFHDLLNIAGGLNGLLTILKMGTDPEEMEDLISRSEEASQCIIDEILMYSQLRAAENGDIRLKIEKVSSISILKDAISRICYHEVGRDKEISIDVNSADIYFQTDRIILERVLINLLKNALEATANNGQVKTGVESDGEKIRFYVHNEGSIPQNIQMQIFNRSFSTKGVGRGIGTYSVRLMTENYLKGRVRFTSNEVSGTVFTVELDLKFPEKNPG
jgi:K+-sensing histidine kinase KdpD